MTAILPRAAKANDGTGRRRDLGGVPLIRQGLRDVRTHRVVLAILSAALYIPGLNQNGWANAYYSAAVQAAAHSWTSFWYASADMGNFISIDKPPLSIWVMALSARIFGVNVWSILLPQALMGICTVLLIHAISRKFLPPVYALFAGAAAATTPVATLMFRYNNPDALLVLVMTLCAWATLQFLRRPSFRMSLAIGASIGLGFMTKQLQVLLIVPAVVVCLLGSRRVSWSVKLRHGALAVGAALLTGLTWFVAVSLVPSASRPFVGGSRTNSVWDLTLGYNGLDRLTGLDAAHTGPAAEGTEPASGFIRFIYPNYAGQVSWLLPLAVAATLLVTVLMLRKRVRSVPAPVVLTAVWWWTSVPVLAYMGGIVHPYYSLVIVPPTAILASWVVRIGFIRGVRRWLRLILACGMLAALLINVIVLILYTQGFAPLLGVVGVLIAVVCAVLALASTPPTLLARITAGLAGTALLAGPLMWSLVTASSGHVGAAPSAGPPGLIGLNDSPDHQGFPASMTPANESVVLGVPPNEALVERVRADDPLGGWAAAAVGGQNSALLALDTGSSVLPLGGFDGSDAAPTLEGFQQLVAEGRVGGLVAGALPPGSKAGSESQRIVQWVEQSFPGSAFGALTYYSFTETR